jgi:hypothetical protein
MLLVELQYYVITPRRIQVSQVTDYLHILTRLTHLKFLK